MNLLIEVPLNPHTPAPTPSPTQLQEKGDDILTYKTGIEVETFTEKKNRSALKTVEHFKAFGLYIIHPVLLHNLGGVAIIKPTEYQSTLNSMAGKKCQQ